MAADQKTSAMRQLPGFGATGVAGLLVNLAVTALCKDLLGLDIAIAYMAGYASALIVGFVICRHLLFKATDQSATSQLVAFTLSSLVFRGMEYGGSLFFHKVLGMHHLVALVVVAAASFFAKFFYYRTFVFKTPKA